MKLLLIAIALFITSAVSDDLDLCIQKKLKLTTPISARDIQAGDFGKVPVATRSALQICHPTFDIVAGQVFKRLKPQSPFSDAEVKCFKIHLMQKNAEGLLTAALDRNLLASGENCDEIVENFTNVQIKQKMPNASAGELQCLTKNIDLYMSGRFKAMIMTREEFSAEIFNDERERFIKELRQVSEELIECLVDL